MNRTAAHLAIAVAAIAGATLGVTIGTADAGTDACQQAIHHADTMAGLHHQVVAKVAAMDMAIQQGQDAQADQLAAQVEDSMDAYTHAHAQYLAASEACR